MNKSTPKRIAVLGIKGLPSLAGADRVVEAIVRGIDHTEYRPVVYCARSVTPAEFQIEGIDLVRLPTLPGKHLGATSLFLFAAIHALLFGRYALVHVHNVEACFVLPLLRLRFPVIATSHGAAQKRDKWGGFAKKVIRLMEYPYIWISNVATSVSKPLADAYEESYGCDIVYIPNGVSDVENVDVAAAREVLAGHGLLDKPYIMFAAGRIIPTKGCHFLLEALNNIEQEIDLLVVGDASHLPEYQKRLHDMANARIHLHTFVSDKSTLLGLVQQAQLFVFPSTVEAMSMMLLEAASVSTPILCSDIPENVTILPNRTVTFASGDVADLQTKLAWALENEGATQQLAEKAKAHVESTYRWHDIVRQYESLYERTLMKVRKNVTRERVSA